MGSITLNFIGNIAVAHDGEPQTLPPSRKTRALLAYLALNPRPFSREYLCELLWEIPDDPRGSLRWSLSKLRRLVNAEGSAHIEADRNSVALNTVVIARVAQDYLLHASSGITSAALGDHDRAIESGRKAMAMLPVATDARYGLVLEADMARIYTMLGESDLALDQLDRLLTIPSWVSVPWIEMHPTWQPLRDHPRYSEILESHQTP